MDKINIVQHLMHQVNDEEIAEEFGTKVTQL